MALEAFKENPLPGPRVFIYLGLYFRKLSDASNYTIQSDSRFNEFFFFVFDQLQ